MILVDTSVVIDYLRGRDVRLLALLPTVSVGLCGIVRAELLCGTRNPKHRRVLLQSLATFHQIPIPEAMWETVGDNLAILRMSGITVPFADAVIATLGLHLNLEVWTRDQQFTYMQRVLPALKLFQEPP